MAVGSHLGIAVDEYDERIRTFVPFYEEMRDVAAGLLSLIQAPFPRIVELGTGNGALAARALAQRPSAQLVGIDEDAAMLRLAASRLARVSNRVELQQASFARVDLPRCDAVVASLALHHVRTRRSKLALYARIADSLAPGGLLVSADCAPPVSPALAERAMDAWRAHLRGTYTARQATAYLQAWAKEDRYFSLDVELSLITQADLVADVVWRRDAFAVMVGRKPSRTRARRSRSA
jgi:tRNA (cmo5U34)-methyltransferase